MMYQNLDLKFDLNYYAKRYHFKKQMIFLADLILKLKFMNYLICCYKNHLKYKVMNKGN